MESQLFKRAAALSYFAPMRNPLAGLLGGLALAAVLQTTSAKGRMETLIRMDEFGNCPDMRGIPMHFNESGVAPWGKTSAGYGTVIVEKTPTDFRKAVITINRCRDAADPSCELFQTWRFDSNLCGLVMMKNVIWSPLFTYDPPARCPPQKGVYKIQNATLDAGKLALINFPTDGYWRVVIETTDSALKKVYCVRFAARFFRSRA